MHHRIFICCMTVTLAAACSTTPKLAVPDGRNRIPANSSAAIDEYKARAADARAEYEARSAMARQLDEVKQDVATIKAFLAARTTEPEIGGAPSAGHTAPARKRPSPLVVKGPLVRTLGKGGPNETIEVREQSLVFRVMHPVSGTRFDPTDMLGAQLLKAATDARMLDIRGRSDANVADAANQRIALQRAQAARHYLLDHGIAPDKIRVSAMAAGGFIAANGDDAGRARNRRVEIEAMDLDTSSYQLTDSIKKGGAQ